MEAAFTMEHSLRNVQIQKMMPQTLHSLQLLSMPLFSLGTYLSGIVLDNPYLEPLFDTMEIPLPAFTEPESEKTTDRDDKSESAGALPFKDQIYFEREGESLYDHLRFQAGLCAFSVQEETVARYLIANISPAGYLEESLETTAAKIGCDLSLAQHVLAVIQGFSPCGVGARSLSECLILQADTKTADYGILIRLLQEDIAALAERKFAFLSRKYGIGRPRIQKLLDYIKTLDPRPGSHFSCARFTPYVMPDATVDLSGPRPEIWVGGNA
ncbi:MAG: hypothetical protein VB064_07850, partial [Oscillospiraceae bacterium]|nr:hypothetical protein [Oscillospiraceae bacterium]